MSTSLLAGERAIITTRQHWSIIAPAVLAAAVLAIAALIVLGILPSSVAGKSIADLKHAGMAVVAIAGVGVIGVRLLQWRAARYVLTDRRIMVARGVLSRYSESISLDRVQNTVVHQSIGARMIGCGDVEIESAGRDGTEVLHRIPHAPEFENALLQAIEQHRAAGPAPAGPPGGV